MGRRNNRADSQPPKLRMGQASTGVQAKLDAVAAKAARAEAHAAHVAERKAMAANGG